MMECCTASLVVVGDEILRGQIVDTNTSYLAKSLRASGIKLRKVTVVPDIVDEIAQVVREDAKQYSLVFTCGGVGPTHDDVTYTAIAKALELKQEVREELLALFEKLVADKDEAYRLATVPTPCEIVYITSTLNKYAVVKARNVYVLPGSPKFFEPAVDEIVPKLSGDTPPFFDYIDINATELSIVKVLDEQAKRWDGKVNIGSYPQYAPEPFTKITLEGSEEDVAAAKAQLLYHLPVQKVRNLKDGFSIQHANAVFHDGQHQTHIKSALDIVLECYKRYKPEEVFLSFNGGKDCTVVLHLAATIAKLQKMPPLLCLYVTGDPFPEIDDFVDKAAQYYGLKLIRKERPLQQALVSLLIENVDIKASLMGTRKGDPGSENLNAFTRTDPGWPSLIRVSPILDWTYDQVWQFLLKYNVPYCSLYDQGYTSLGTKATTVPNPRLKDPNNPSRYFPAYTLTDESAERQGRV